MKNSDSKDCRRFYGHGIPNVKPEQLAGKLIVVEGAGHDLKRSAGLGDKILAQLRALLG